MQQADGQPHRRRIAHGIDGAHLPHQAAGAHARARRNIAHLKAQCGHWPQHRAGHNRRNPDFRVFHNIGHLQHTGAQALAEQACPAVFFKAHHRKAHHLRTTAHCGRTCRQAAERQGNGNGRAGNRQGEDNAHQHRHHHPHQQGLQFHRPHNQCADFGHHRRNRRADKLRHRHPCHQRYRRGGDNVYRRGFAHQLAAFRTHCRGNKTAHRPAQCRAGGAGGHAGQEHQRRCF